MPHRIDIGAGQQVAVEDGTELSKDERADMELLADMIEDSLPTLMGKRILGFVVGGMKVALRVAPDKEGP